ncbi:hypothetical protein ACFXKS_35445 [Streptomyces scopuliridis]|uniref:hypothetical protein n=2 Tax=Streptomyces scopuliridis TaxID=452529 RepID=UPI003690C8F0
MKRVGERGRFTSWPFAAAGTSAVLALIAGCSGGSGGEASALSEQQIELAVPDAKAVPGWETVSARASGSMKEQTLRGSLCPKKGQEACKGARFMGTARFKGAERMQVGFWAIAYQDEKSAESAYDLHWDWYRKGLAETETVDLGSLGEQRDAEQGISGYQGDKRAIAQVRVGTVVLWASLDASRETGIDAGLVKDLASVFTVRAREAQDGQTPAAELGA